MIRHVELRHLSADDVVRAEREGVEFTIRISAVALRAFALRGQAAAVALRATAVPVGAGPVSRRPLLWRIVAISEDILDLVGETSDGLSPLTLLEAVSWQSSDPADDVGRYELIYAAIALLDGEGFALLQHRANASYVVLTDAGRALHERDRAGEPPSTRPGRASA